MLFQTNQQRQKRAYVLWKLYWKDIERSYSLSQQINMYRDTNRKKRIPWLMIEIVVCERSSPYIRCCGHQQRSLPHDSDRSADEGCDPRESSDQTRTPHQLYCCSYWCCYLKSLKVSVHFPHHCH